MAVLVCEACASSHRHLLSRRLSSLCGAGFWPRKLVERTDRFPSTGEKAGEILLGVLPGRQPLRTESVTPRVRAQLLRGSWSGRPNYFAASFVACHLRHASVYQSRSRCRVKGFAAMKKRVPFNGRRLSQICCILTMGCPFLVPLYGTTFLGGQSLAVLYATLRCADGMVSHAFHGNLDYHGDWFSAFFFPFRCIVAFPCAIQVCCRLLYHLLPCFVGCPRRR